MTNPPADLLETRWSLIRRLSDLDDQASWRDFFEAYWRLIYSVATKSGLTHMEAQNVVQETIISVCRKIADFRADPAAGSFRSWLLTLTRWRIGDAFRKRGRGEALPHHLSGNLDPDADPATAGGEELPGLSGNLLEAVWEEEREQNLREAAFERLKARVHPKHYQLFYLLTVKGLPAPKVAQTMGVSLGLVYVAKHRVAVAFRKALSEARARAEAT